MKKREKAVFVGILKSFAAVLAIMLLFHTKIVCRESHFIDESAVSFGLEFQP